ncbi:MAG: hypothetical protein V1769_01510 [Thermoplasmatota archaeon]
MIGMKLLRALKNGTKIYRVKGKKIDYHGREYECDYLVHRKPQTYHPSVKDPCGNLFESWDEELGDWNP